MIYLALVAFVMMILQSGLTYFQYKNYQQAVNSLLSQGTILGIGLHKGGFRLKGGAIIVLAMDCRSGRICGCKKLEGIALWKRFLETDYYNGLSLSEIREVGLAEDLKINKKRRIKEPYAPNGLDKKRKKGALIQAVEAIDKRLEKDVKNAQYLKRRETERAMGNKQPRST
ncbi:MAG: hypothetical protein PWP56_874 [Acetobacterium sp.]|nr:hypothetical protein [Acetobacterium sp.]